MKHLLTFLAFVAISTLSTFAKDVTTTTIDLPTLQCGMCKKTIESKVGGIDGLDSIYVDVDTKTATVTFDSEVTTLATIEQAIAKAGYDANAIKADRVAQRKLHPCCRPGAHE